MASLALSLIPLSATDASCRAAIINHAQVREAGRGGVERVQPLGGDTGARAFPIPLDRAPLPPFPSTLALSPPQTHFLQGMAILITAAGSHHRGAINTLARVAEVAGLRQKVGRG